MSTQRERFWKAFYSKWPKGSPFSVSEEHFELFQLGEASGMESAAKVCDQQQQEPECPERAEYCAEQIRALMAQGEI